MPKRLVVAGIGVLLSGSPAAPAGVQSIEYIDPAGGFTQVVTATAGGVTTVHVSGQVAEGDDFRTQVEAAFSGVVRRLEQAGASVHDVVKMRALVKNMTGDRYRTVADVRRRTFPEGSWPTSTVAGVQSLARESYEFEVEGEAVVAEEGVDLSVERFAPSNGFSGAVAVTAHEVKTIYISGQVGEGGGLAMQSASVWQRIAQRLEDAGASFSDLVKTTTYIVDLDPATFFALYQDGVPPAVWNLDDHAASTVIGVPSLANDRFVVEVDAVAVMGVGGQSVAREFIDPTRSFYQAVTTRGSGPKTVYVSGQVGRPGDPFAAQADQAYTNLQQLLEAAGATVADLLKVTVYVPGYGEDNLRALSAVRQKHGFTDGSAPASTLLGIQSLYASEAAIEVEGVAVVR